MWEKEAKHPTSQKSGRRRTYYNKLWDIRLISCILLTFKSQLYCREGMNILIYSMRIGGESLHPMKHVGEGGKTSKIVMSKFTLSNLLSSYVVHDIRSWVTSYISLWRPPGRGYAHPKFSHESSINEGYGGGKRRIHLAMRKYTNTLESCVLCMLMTINSQPFF